MTIVLQHEFWGLEVLPERFAVTLSFGSAPQRLEIPYDAVRVFADPSVEFGLQFTVAPRPTRPARRHRRKDRASGRPRRAFAELPAVGGRARRAAARGAGGRPAAPRS